MAMFESGRIPTTEDIVSRATELGHLIARHSATTAYREAVDALEMDVDAQRLLTDYNRLVHALAEKETKGGPIEVEEKHRLRESQSAMAMNPILSRMQVTQMDYVDLMRKVESAMAEAAGGISGSADPAAI